MSPYMINVTKTMPTREQAQRIGEICREEGGYGLVEANVKEGSDMGLKGGRYMGWMTGHNRGSPFDQDMAKRVRDRIDAEVLRAA